MIIYILGTAVSVLFAKIASAKEINGKKLSKGLLRTFELLAMIPFILIAGTRIDVGTDYAAYEQLYLHPEWFTHFSEGFMIFVRILRSVSLNPRLFFAITSVIIYATFVHTAVEESEGAAFSVLFFVISEDFFVSMNIVSQFLAMVFIWRATSELIKGRVMISVALCLMAAAIHPTALCFILLILLFKIEYSIKRLAAIVAVICAAGIVGTKYLIPFIVRYSRYGRYFSTHYAVNKFSVAVPLLLIYVVIFITIVFLVDLKFLEKDSKCRAFTISVLLNIAIMVLSFGLTSNAYRFTYYFGGSMAFYFPSVLNKMQNKKNRYIVEAAVLVLFTVWTTMLIMHHNQNALPYRSFL